VVTRYERPQKKTQCRALPDNELRTPHEDSRRFSRELDPPIGKLTIGLSVKEPTRICPSRITDASTDGNGRRLSVLIVDNYPDAADTLAMLVRLWGHDAAVVATGAEALRAGTANRPDVVLLELRLPDLDGCEVARALREESAGKRLLIVAVTTCGRADDRWRAAEAGIDLHLVKPANPEDLFRALWQFARLVPHGLR
jgi:CheY-like chemotaxis protein